jgi:hypothetical protein
MLGEGGIGMCVWGGRGSVRVIGAFLCTHVRVCVHMRSVDEYVLAVLY